MNGNTSSAGISRRDFLRVGAAAVGAGSIFAACGGTSSSTTTTHTTQTTQAPGTPKRGGRLRIGLTGGAGSENLNPLVTNSELEVARANNLFNCLTEFDDNAQAQLALAEEFSPNSTATEWTVRLRKDITFHDGKPLTADDVIYTYRLIADPKSPLAGAIGMSAVDVAGMKKLDPLTVRIPCHYPYTALADIQPCYAYYIVPVGFDPKHPVGTGPFKYKSFAPGNQSTFVSNKDYWATGPYVDELVISDYASETSQINALLSDEADMIGALSAASIHVVHSGGAKTLIYNGGSYSPFTMRVDQAPFNDVRVRQAFRLMVDREEMLKLIFSGYGALGNDTFGIWDPVYDHALPQRHQDLAQAKHLLKQAGHDGLTIELVSADIAAGTILVAQVFKQQAASAGVTININPVGTDVLYGPNYLKWTFAQDWWAYLPYFLNAAEGMLPGSAFNECHNNDPAYASLYRQAVGELDTAKRDELVHEMQTREYEGVSSGFIIPYFIPNVDGYSKRVQGLVPNRVGTSLSNFNFKAIWFA